VAAELLRGDAGRVQPLDGVESGALALLLAFDLARFELGFAIGTDHPRAGWADRVPADMKPAGWPGPDGFDSFAPLVPNGMLDPPSVARAVATFTGGFKRQHGAMHEGELAHRRHASHYGFVEQGTVLSRLQPGLSTLLVRDDGGVDLKTWTEADDARLEHVRHARQNGVPLIERRAGDADAAGTELAAQENAVVDRRCPAEGVSLYSVAEGDQEEWLLRVFALPAPVAEAGAGAATGAEVSGRRHRRRRR
jgi:hypothetical protein